MPAASSKLRAWATWISDAARNTRFTARRSLAQRREKSADVVAALERLDQRGADDDAVDVRCEARDLIARPDSEAGAHRYLRGALDAVHVLEHFIGDGDRLAGRARHA